jgi:hypothetical protein
MKTMETRKIRMLSKGIKGMINSPLITFLLLTVMMLPSYVYGERDQALNQSIVEGQSILGIKLGDSEADIFRNIGFPDKIESDFTTSEEGLKFLIYGLDKNTAAFIFTRRGKVELIQILWSGDGLPAYRGKTLKGIGLGDPMEDVKKYYGECEMSREYCWHKKQGISLGGDKVVIFIIIAPAGKELPDYLKSSF